MIGRMKRAIIFFSMFIFLSLLIGCENITSEHDVNRGDVIEETKPILTPSATAIATTPSLETPYPLESEVNQPYPKTSDEPSEEGNDLTGEVPTPVANQVPTVHVDVILRATDPQAFVLASGGYQLVEFFAYWCPTCKSMAPVLRNLEHKYSGKIQFIYLDIDDPRTNPFKQSLGFQYQPHLFLIDGEGKVIKQWVGYVTEDELDAVLSAFQ